MPTGRDRFHRLAALVGAALWATAEALAQENPARLARRIVVSIPDHKLAVLEGSHVVRVFETAVGAPCTPSPTGSFTIVQRIPDPAWYTKGRIVPPGKSNPLGPRWLGLSKKGYGIHGTNNPASIGRNASHGCIRLRNSDIEELFEMVSVGDEVELRGERTPETDWIFDQTLTAEVAVLVQ
jgi:lipoprotein-anchoring transpeptidase ErfK/SrfK